MTGMIVTTVLMIAVYLFVVRFVDMNEKEPLWAMAMFFVLGGAVFFVLSWIVDPSVLELDFLRGALIKEVGRFLAIGAGVMALTAYGQVRGWDEFNGTMDGIVYGATAGLGYATARQVMTAMVIGSVAIPGSEVGMLSGFGTAALAGLSHGVFGAIIGASIGAATEARSPIARASLPVLGLIGASLADFGYMQLAYGNALGGTQGFIRAQVALGLPVVLIIVVAVYALAQERKSIRAYLQDEGGSGVVTADDLMLLNSVPKRELAYLKYLFTFKLGTWSKTKDLHNLQAQLAFTKGRAASEKEPSRRARWEADASKIRAAVLDKKRALGMAPEATQQEGS